MAGGRDKDNTFAKVLAVGAGVLAGGILGGLAYLRTKDELQRPITEDDDDQSSERRTPRTLLSSDESVSLQARRSVFGDRRKNDTDEMAIGLGAGVGLVAGGIIGGFTYLLCKDDEDGLDINEIGVNFNEWRMPRRLTPSEMGIATRFCDAMEHELDLKDNDWTKATGAVNKVLGLLMREIQKESRTYEGLVIEDYVKQGSSREGLKVFAADEFDVLLQYHFENLDFEVENISSGGRILPELAYLRVYSTMDSLSMTHPKLYKRGVFTERDGDAYLNTRNLQEKVFRSLIASASSTVEKTVNQGEFQEQFEFKIRVRLNPPSVNIEIELTDEGEDYSVLRRLEDIQFECQGGYAGVLCSEIARTTTYIDVDIVPGLLLFEDRVPDPTNKKRTMSCPRYAVFKWLTENHRSASRYGASPALLWRVCSSGYEKHVIDVAQGKVQQRSIVKALRLLKLYFRNMKKNMCPPPQVVTVLRSYHLKHIALYCILYLRILNDVRVKSVDVALAYMLAFLEVCLEERKLPHFFHANDNITEMFPDFECDPRSFRYDLLGSKDKESFNQAIRSFRVMKNKMVSVLRDQCSVDMDLLVSDVIVEHFRRYVTSGRYYE